jgi:putative DNA primase/helicase
MSNLPNDLHKHSLSSEQVFIQVFPATQASRRPTPIFSDLDEIRERLKSGASDVAEALLGPRNRKLSNKREWRWGNKGSIAVVVSGPKAGCWRDHERNEGGDLIDLVQREERCDFLGALQWAREFLGMPEPDGSEPTPEQLALREADNRERARRRAEQEAKRKAEEVEDDNQKIRAAQALWARTKPVRGTVAHIDT